MTSSDDTTSKTPGNLDNDYNELDLIYRIKAGGVSYWASAMIIDTDKEGNDIIGAVTADSF